jgi:hypothetical protein
MRHFSFAVFKFHQGNYKLILCSLMDIRHSTKYFLSFDAELIKLVQYPKVMLPTFTFVKLEINFQRVFLAITPLKNVYWVFLRRRTAIDFRGVHQLHRKKFASRRKKCQDGS